MRKHAEVYDTLVEDGSDRDKEDTKSFKFMMVMLVTTMRTCLNLV